MHTTKPIRFTWKAWLFDPRFLARSTLTTLQVFTILAELYETTGAYESMAIRSHVLGKKHAGYAASLNILAALFVTTDAYDKAEQPYVECMALQSEVLGKRSHLGFQIQRAEVAVKKISTTPTPA